MPNTPRGYPYPSATGVAPDVPYDLQRLASAVDSDVAGLFPDTGWVSSGITRATGWNAVSGYTVQVRKVRNLVTLRGAVQYGSGSLYGVALVTVPIGYRPTVSTWLGQVHSSAGASGLVGMLQVLASGAVTIPSGYGQGSLPVGTVIPLTGTWLTD